MVPAIGAGTTLANLAYDAAYLQRALARDALLVTLDARLAAAWDEVSGDR